MKTSDIRRELLEQHAHIREMTETIETIAKRARGGDPEAGDLQGCIGRLAEAVQSHSAREEALLEGLLPALAESGVSVMDREHKQAHARLDAAIQGIPSLSIGLAAVAVVALARLVREHMDREEAAFLNERVLRDEPAPPA